MGVAGVLLRGLQVTCTANQDTPLPLWPLFNVDLWEHAFIPDYENRREDYVEAALAIIDWTRPPAGSGSGRQGRGSEAQNGGAEAPPVRDYPKRRCPFGEKAWRLPRA